MITTMNYTQRTIMMIKIRLAAARGTLARHNDC